MSLESSLHDGIAAALFVPTWADYQEEIDGENPGPGGDWMGIAPESPYEAEQAARDFANQLARLNGEGNIITLLMQAARANGIKGDNLDGEVAYEFGWGMAMKSLGTGVSWEDNYKDTGIKTPHIEAYWDGEELHIEGIQRFNPVTVGPVGRGHVHAFNPPADYRKDLEREAWRLTHRDYRSSGGGVKKILRLAPDQTTELVPIHSLSDEELNEIYEGRHRRNPARKGPPMLGAEQMMFDSYREGARWLHDEGFGYHAHESENSTVQIWKSESGGRMEATLTPIPHGGWSAIIYTGFTGNPPTMTAKKVGGTWVNLKDGTIQFRWPAEGRQMTFASIEDTRKSYGNKSGWRYETDHDGERHEGLREAKKSALAYALNRIREEGYGFDEQGVPIPE